MNKTLKVMTSAALLASVVAPVAVTTVDAAGISKSGTVGTVKADTTVNLGSVLVDIPAGALDGVGDSVVVTLPSGFKFKKDNNRDMIAADWSVAQPGAGYDYYGGDSVGIAGTPAVAAVAGVYTVALAPANITIDGQTFAFGAGIGQFNTTAQLAALINTNIALSPKYVAADAAGVLQLTQRAGQETPTAPVVGAGHVLATVTAGVTGVAAVPAVAVNSESASAIRVPATLPGSGRANPLYDGVAPIAPLSIAQLSDREIRITSNGVNNLTDNAVFYLNLGSVYVDNDHNGPVDLTFTAPTGSGFPTGTVTVASTSSSGSVKVATTDTQTGNNAFNFDLRLEETLAGSLKDGNKTFRIKLPEGYEFNEADITAPTTVTAAGGTVIYGQNSTLTIDYDKREMTIALPAKTTQASFWELTNIDFRVVDESKVKDGDIMAQVFGDSSTDVNEVKVGTYGEFGVTVKTAKTDAPTILAAKTGDESQVIDDIVFKESLTASFVAGRTVTLTLPEGAKWAFTPGSETDSGVTFGAASLTNDDKTLRYTIAGGSAGTAKAEIKLEDLEVVTKSSFAGDLKVTVAGSAGVQSELTVAKVVKPVTAEATSDVTDVILGTSGVKAADFTITESKAGAIESQVGANTVVLTLPDGVSFDKLPTIKVAEGDLDIEDIQYVAGSDNKQVQFTVDSSSDVTSKIQVSDVALKLYRYLPEGGITLKVQGNAINQNGAYFLNDATATQLTIANVVTPAEGQASAKEVAFTIGSTTYTVAGVEQTMDVAPFVEAGRTYMPIRYVAEAVGADSILWDQASSTATVLKGDRVVQLTAGSKSLKVNGASITMDAAAKVKDGRTVLPIRFVGQALGAKVDYNEADKTVTVK